MARRRKKSKKPPSIAPKVDKSLPALPPQEPASSSFTPDLDTPSEAFSEPPTTDASPRPPHPRRGDSSSNFRRDASPIPDLSRKGSSCQTPMPCRFEFIANESMIHRQHNTSRHHLRQRRQSLRTSRYWRRRHPSSLRSRPKPGTRPITPRSTYEQDQRPTRSKVSRKRRGKERPRLLQQAYCRSSRKAKGEWLTRCLQRAKADLPTAGWKPPYCLPREGKATFGHNGGHAEEEEGWHQ